MTALFTLSTIVAAANFGDNLAALMTSVIGPIFLIVCGIVAFKFLKDQQIMQFVIFLVVAIVVAAIIYSPQFIKQVGTGLGGEITW